MNFKEQLEKDLNAFINIDEFAEIHNIDGREIPAVVDEDIFKERPRQPYELYLANEGVYVDTITLFVRMADLGERPVIGQNLRVDGERYIVANCSESAGTLVITLETNRA